MPGLPATQVFDAGGMSRSDLLALGRSLRKKAKRKDHARWRPDPSRPDPIAVLKSQEMGRVSELLPIRYGRMLESPFRFYRGAAAIMAWDLARTPSTGVNVQACGDAHSLNFGIYGSPLRQLIFDVNDFDETLPAPWEYDLKRLSAGAFLDALDLGFAGDVAADCVRALVGRYCAVVDELAQIATLDIHYAHVEARDFLSEQDDQKVVSFTQKVLRKARKRTNKQFYEKYVTEVDGTSRFIEDPPLLQRLADREIEHLHSLFDRYRSTLQSDRRHVLDQFRLRDGAHKVVGVGSVGLRSYVLLLEGRGEPDPLIIQIKQAVSSVLSPYVGPSGYDRHGQRVVVGQRVMQAASDPFLGWVSSDEHDYYVRQARDLKGSTKFVPDDPRLVLASMRLCGGTLARSHARSVDPALLRGYLGSVTDGFAEALVEFAVAYADQTERDHDRLAKAVKKGDVDVEMGV